MKKAKQIHKKQDSLKPEQALQFLEDFQSLVRNKDSKTRLISIRVPENILDTFKLICESQNIKYQSQIVKLMREWLKSK